MKLIQSIITLSILLIISFITLYNVNKPKSLIQQPKSKTVLITGASSGIGKEFALWFGQQKDWKIILTARNEEQLNNVKEQILNISSNTKVEIIPTELCSQETVQKLVEKVKEVTENLDVVINCAGITHKVPDDLIDLSQDEIEKMIQINVIAFTCLARQITKEFFQPQKYGLFLQFASGAALLNQPMMTIYCASKNYQISLIKCLNEEVKAFNAHFVAICPLYVCTPMTMTNRTTWLFISPQTLVDEVVRSNLQMQYFVPHWSHKLVINSLNMLPNSLNKNILYSRMITTRGKIINKLNKMKKQQQHD